MLKFKVTQKVFEIGGVKIGGQPGENPTVLIGSIFYRKHRIVINDKTGEFDKKRAEKLIKLKEEFIDKTGIPGMIDVIGSTEEAICKFIDFTADHTEIPLLIDSPSANVRISGFKHAKEIGLEKRIIYNSIMPEAKQEELKTIKEIGVEIAILLAYKSGFMTSEMRVKALEELLLKVKEIGVAKPLLDTFVIDLPSISIACKAILNLKSKYGLPCGCGSHNAITTWTGLRKHLSVKAIRPCTIAVNLTPIILSADFIIYGPIENCKYIYPAVYTIYTLYKHVMEIDEYIEFNV